MLFALSIARELILSARREDLAAIGERNARSIGVVGSVFRKETLNSHSHALLNDGSIDAAPLQLTGRSSGEPPIRNFAARIFDIDIEPNVRVLPFDSGDNTGDLDGLRRIKFGGERVMGSEWICRTEQKGSDSFHAGAPLGRLSQILERDSMVESGFSWF